MKTPMTMLGRERNMYEPYRDPCPYHQFQVQIQIKIQIQIQIQIQIKIRYHV